MVRDTEEVRRTFPQEVARHYSGLLEQRIWVTKSSSTRLYINDSSYLILRKPHSQRVYKLKEHKEGQQIVDNTQLKQILSAKVLLNGC